MLAIVSLLPMLVSSVFGQVRTGWQLVSNVREDVYTMMRRARVSDEVEVLAADEEAGRREDKKRSTAAAHRSTEPVSQTRQEDDAFMLAVFGAGWHRHGNGFETSSRLPGRR
eukprot:638907-Hanusia_phi.AAC.1